MSINKKFSIIYSIFGFLLVLFLGLIIIFNQNREELQTSQRIRFQSYLRADELRQSSDDLTRFARTYAISADAKYETFYNRILDIRNGKAVRPDHYHRIYWDLILNEKDMKNEGRVVALRKMMEELGFTDEEFAKLKEAQDNPDALVGTEIIAMNAIKGIFAKDAFLKKRTGESDQQFAIRILHDNRYHQAKKQIMQPINEFFQLIEERTTNRVNELKNRQNYLMVAMELLVLAFALTILVSYYLIRKRIIRPIDQFVNVDRLMQKAGMGDLRLKATVESRDEIGAIMGEFNNMLNSQKSVIEQLKKTIEAINSFSSIVNQNSSESAEVQEVVVQSTQNLAGTIESLSISIEKASHASDEIYNQINQGVENTEFLEKQSAESRQQSIEGVENIKSITEKMNEISSSVAHSADLMEKMKTQSTNIDMILATIAEIADQTNLLALNAAIEAARAGSSGKGFRVVASEVSKLADQSMQSSVKIKKMIQELNLDIQNLAIAIQSNTQSVAKGREHILQTGKLFEFIHSAILNQDEIISKLAQSSDILATNNDAYKKSMQQIGKIQKISQTNVDEILQSIQQQSQSIEKISSRTEELYAVSENLTAISEEFQV